MVYDGSALPYGKRDKLSIMGICQKLLVGKGCDEYSGLHLCQRVQRFGVVDRAAAMDQRGSLSQILHEGPGDRTRACHIGKGVVVRHICRC